MEKKIRISIRCGKYWKDVTFPIPQEMENELLEYLKVEDAMTGEPFHSEGSRNIKVRVEVFNFEKTF